MTTVEVLTLTAIVTGPIAAVLISLWLQRRYQRIDARKTVLSALVANRHQVLSQDTVRALNLIDLVFHDEPKVRKLWTEYFEMLGNEGLNNPVGWDQRNKKNVELITEIAKCVGLGRHIAHLDIQRTYSPVGLGQQEARLIELQTELIRVLKSTERLSSTERDSGN